MAADSAVFGISIIPKSFVAIQRKQTGAALLPRPEQRLNRVGKPPGAGGALLVSNGASAVSATRLGGAVTVGGSTTGTIARGAPAEHTLMALAARARDACETAGYEFIAAAAEGDTAIAVAGDKVSSAAGQSARQRTVGRLAVKKRHRKHLHYKNDIVILSMFENAIVMINSALCAIDVALQAAYAPGPLVWPRKPPF